MNDKEKQLWQIYNGIPATGLLELMDRVAVKLNVEPYDARTALLRVFEDMWEIWEKEFGLKENAEPDAEGQP